MKKKLHFNYRDKYSFYLFNMVVSESTFLMGGPLPVTWPAHLLSLYPDAGLLFCLGENSFVLEGPQAYATCGTY